MNPKDDINEDNDDKNNNNNNLDKGVDSSSSINRKRRKKRIKKSLHDRANETSVFEALQNDTDITSSLSSSDGLGAYIPPIFTQSNSSLSSSDGLGAYIPPIVTQPNSSLSSADGLGALSSPPRTPQHNMSASAANAFQQSFTTLNEHIYGSRENIFSDENQIDLFRSTTPSLVNRSSSNSSQQLNNNSANLATPNLLISTMDSYSSRFSPLPDISIINEIRIRGRLEAMRTGHLTPPRDTVRNTFTAPGAPRRNTSAFENRNINDLTPERTRFPLTTPVSASTEEQTIHGIAAPHTPVYNRITNESSAVMSSTLSEPHTPNTRVASANENLTPIRRRGTTRSSHIPIFQGNNHVPIGRAQRPLVNIGDRAAIPQRNNNQMLRRVPNLHFLANNGIRNLGEQPITNRVLPPIPPVHSEIAFRRRLVFETTNNDNQTSSTAPNHTINESSAAMSSSLSEPRATNTRISGVTAAESNTRFSRDLTRSYREYLTQNGHAHTGLTSHRVENTENQSTMQQNNNNPTIRNGRRRRPRGR